MTTFDRLSMHLSAGWSTPSRMPSSHILQNYTPPSYCEISLASMIREGSRYLKTSRILLFVILYLLFDMGTAINRDDDLTREPSRSVRGLECDFVSWSDPNTSGSSPLWMASILRPFGRCLA